MGKEYETIYSTRNIIGSKKKTYEKHSTSLILKRKLKQQRFQLTKFFCNDKNSTKEEFLGLVF